MLRNDCSRVLCISRDRLLGETRQMVLQTRFAVTTIYSFSEIAQMYESFRLVVLCHSLSQEECELAYIVARRTWPDVQVLALSTSSRLCGPGSYDQALVGMPEPKILLQKVGEMLSQQPAGTYRAWLGAYTEEWGAARDSVEDRALRAMEGMGLGKVMIH